LIVVISLATLTGLADGLALKELRYAAPAAIRPNYLGPPLFALCGEDSAEVVRHVSNR